jgi:hypothetical protein
MEYNLIEDFYCLKEGRNKVFRSQGIFVAEVQTFLVSRGEE